MSYFEKVKDLLIELDYPIVKEDTEDSLFVVSSEERGIYNLILDCEGDILVLEQHFFNVDESKAGAFKRLLQINRQLVHGALTLAESSNKVLFRDTLQLENIDANELEASINSLSLTLAEYGQEFMSLALQEEEKAEA